jgi:hypothetical protein
MTRVPILDELMYEIDSLYVSTEMILSRRFREPPLDGLLLEACLLHFRVVWDFFYRAKDNDTDVVVHDYVPNWAAIDPPVRLREIRKWLNAMLAHLTTRRIDPSYKAGEMTEEDIKLIRKHTKTLYSAFAHDPTGNQRYALVNPHEGKFAQYEMLNRRPVDKA